MNKIVGILFLCGNRLEARRNINYSLLNKLGIANTNVLTRSDIRQIIDHLIINQTLRTYLTEIRIFLECGSFEWVDGCTATIKCMYYMIILLIIAVITISNKNNKSLYLGRDRKPASRNGDPPINGALCTTAKQIASAPATAARHRAWVEAGTSADGCTDIISKIKNAKDMKSCR